MRCDALFVLFLVLSEAVLVLVLEAILVLAAVSTSIEYEYRFAEYRFSEYEHGEIRCEARTFIVDRSRLRGPRLPC